MSPRLTTQILQVGAPMSAASWSAIKPRACGRLEPRPTSSKIWLIRVSLDVGISKTLGQLVLGGLRQSDRSDSTVILVCQYVEINNSIGRGGRFFGLSSLSLANDLPPQHGAKRQNASCQTCKLYSQRSLVPATANGREFTDPSRMSFLKRFTRRFEAYRIVQIVA